MDLVSACMRWIRDFVRRFLNGDPKNTYEQAVFQALRTMIIAAFLKPLKESHAVTT